MYAKRRAETGVELDQPPESSSVLLFETRGALEGVPDILAPLSQTELAQVLKAGQQVAFEAGDALFRQGEVH